MRLPRKKCICYTIVPELFYYFVYQTMCCVARVFSIFSFRYSSDVSSYYHCSQPFLCLGCRRKISCTLLYAPCVNFFLFSLFSSVLTSILIHFPPPSLSTPPPPPPTPLRLRLLLVILLLPSSFLILLLFFFCSYFCCRYCFF